MAKLSENYGSETLRFLEKTPLRFEYLSFGVETIFLGFRWFALRCDRLRRSDRIRIVGIEKLVVDQSQTTDAAILPDECSYLPLQVADPAKVIFVRFIILMHGSKRSRPLACSACIGGLHLEEQANDRVEVHIVRCCAGLDGIRFVDTVEIARGLLDRISPPDIRICKIPMQ